MTSNVVTLDDKYLLERGQVVGSDDPLPDFPFEQLQQLLRGGVLDFAPLIDHHDFGGGGFHIRNNVRGEDDDSFSR